MLCSFFGMFLFTVWLCRLRVFVYSFGYAVVLQVGLLTGFWSCLNCYTVSWCFLFDCAGWLGFDYLVIAGFFGDLLSFWYASFDCVLQFGLLCSLSCYAVFLVCAMFAQVVGLFFNRFVCLASLLLFWNWLAGFDTCYTGWEFCETVNSLEFVAVLTHNVLPLLLCAIFMVLYPFSCCFFNL